MTQPAGTTTQDRMGGVPVSLRHDGWSLAVRGDEVADLCWGGVLLLRAVRPVVRDRDWNTVPVTVVAAHRSDDGDAMESQLLFQEALLSQEVGISYQGTLTVTLQGDTATVDFRGQPLTTFDRNRIGLVLLHPATDAGGSVEVQHGDGRLEHARWPQWISPHQPFRDVTGFRWQRDGVTATVALSGDTFETEDQRNWTDASFKTYSTPLDLPFPVTVSPDDRCHQQVRVTATGRARPNPRRADDQVTVSNVVTGTLPPISLGAGLYPSPAQVPDHRVGYDTVLVELTGPADSWPALLAAATAQADAFGASLDLRLVTADPAVARHALTVLPLSRVTRLAVVDPVSHISTLLLWRALTVAAGERGFEGELVAGTRAYFTELNRLFDQLPQEAAALTFSLTPQMHATEIPHLVDSLAAQTTVAENALRLAGGRAVHVGPITLARRFNAVATSGPTDPATDAARAVDPLLGEDFAAAWTLGSVAALGPTGVAGLCYHETVGPRGILAEDLRPRPVAAVLDQLAGLSGRPLLATSTPPGTAALTVRTAPGRVRLLVANLSADPRTLTVDAPGERGSSLTLGPWAVAGAELRS